MQTPGQLPLGLVTVIVFVVPGLIGLEMYFRTSQRSRELSRTRLIVYSSVISLVSLAVVYLFSGPLISISETAGNWVVNNGFVSSATTSVEVLPSLCLPTVVALYAIHLIVAVSVGVFLGYLSYYVIDYGVSRDRRDPWELGFEDYADEGSEIVVVLKNGRSLAGTHKTQGWDRNRRELLIINPRDITGGTATQFDVESVEINEGRQQRVSHINTLPQSISSVLLTSSSISTVYYFEIDRDSSLARYSSDSADLDERPPKITNPILFLKYKYKSRKQADPDSVELDSLDNSREGNNLVNKSKDNK